MFFVLRSSTMATLSPIRYRLWLRIFLAMCHRHELPPSVINPFPGQVTGFTSTLTPKVGVEHVIRMSSGTVGTASLYCRHTLSPQDIDLVCYNFHMSGIHTEWVPTQMVYNQTLRNGAISQCVGEAMCIHHPIIDPEAPVAVSSAAQPCPTAIRFPPNIERESYKCAYTPQTNGHD